MCQRAYYSFQKECDQRKVSLSEHLSLQKAELQNTIKEQ